jgi:16S rRNA (adenine(1408)-N(1))-methyltransferase
VIVDVGTGDGRAVLDRAFEEPTALVVGIDASAAAMATSSRRAARRGPHNALFFATGAEQLADSVFAARSDLVTVTFPWGSLLRGVLGLDRAALAGVAALLCPGGRLRVLASVVPSDGVAGMACLDETQAARIRDGWRAAGLELTSFRPATPEEVAASRSTWARRLRAAPAAHDTRPVMALEGRRMSIVTDGDGFGTTSRG